MMKLSFVLLFIPSVIFGQNDFTIKDLIVLDEPAAEMMKNYMTGIVDRQFAVRDSMLGALKTAKDWDSWAEKVRDSMISWTGPFPERAPLNGRVTGRLERDGYTIEKVLFESRPNYYVSGMLYVPKDLSTPRPALINLVGHRQHGKADERYQRMSIAQVKNGFMVLTIDQMGQGERGLLSSHKILGKQATISGAHTFNFMIWDVIRSIDYMISRPEVDPENICMTGNSGGGMMTTYIHPFENRIKVAVPTCSPNTWSERVHANLATDDEQVFFGAFESGIDPRGDPLFAYVPKPLLINATTDDHLNPPRGVWALNTWLYKSYAAHGAPEKLSTTMVKEGHHYNMEQREITHAWMRRWTGNNPTDFWEDKEVLLEDEKDLWATPSGSVFNELGSKKPKELVLEYLNEHRAEWAPVKSSANIESHKTKMAELISGLLNMDFSKISVKGEIKNQKIIKENLSIRSFILEPEAGIVLPGVILEPMSTVQERKFILYLNDNGKTELLKDLDVIKDLLDEGYSICAVDLRGMGETTKDLDHKYWDFLSGKPIFGQRVKDVLAIVNWLKGPAVEAEQIKLWGTGMCALYGAFAGIFSDGISDYVLEEPLISFESVVQVEVPAYHHEVILPGILEKFDMAQVYQALCPKKVSVLNPLSGDKAHSKTHEFNKIDKEVSATYKSVNIRDFWSMERLEYLQRGQAIMNRLK